MGEHQGQAGGLTGIGEPLPAEHAFGANGEVVPVGGDEFKEELEVVVLDVGMDQFFTVPIHDAHVHLACVEVDSAVELRGGNVILHNDQSLWGRKPRYQHDWLRGKVPSHFPALRLHAITNHRGL